MKNLLLAVVFVAASAQALATINIDFGMPADTPPPTYAGAGAPGLWNVISSLGATPIGGIVDGSGNATSLSIVASQSLAPVIADAGDPPILQPDRALLGDYLCGSSGSVTLTFSGMVPGQYRLTTYCIANQDSPGDITPTNVSPFGNAALTAQISGYWQGSLQQGVTHSIHELSIPDDSFTLGISVDNDVFINGVQLVELPEPSIASMLAMSLLAFHRPQKIC